MNLSYLSEIAIQAAQDAGAVIQKYIHEEIKVMVKSGGASYASQIVTIVDKECEEAILRHLLPTCRKYDLALLSEETEDDGSRHEKEYFWCVDPMDGTLAFINKRPGFAVSIALVSKLGIPQIGVVFDPCTGTLYQAMKGGGVFKNGEKWEVKNINTHLTYVTDRKLEDTPRSEEIKKFLKTKQEELNLRGIKETSGGGSVMNAIRVLENGPACMLKYPKKEKGGGCSWDFAATACIFSELGLVATNMEGNALDLNRKGDTFMNHEGVFYANF